MKVGATNKNFIQKFQKTLESLLIRPILYLNCFDRPAVFIKANKNPAVDVNSCSFEINNVYSNILTIYTYY